MPGRLVARALTFHHGPAVILDGVSLNVGSGDRIGVVGPNGVGKSTLLRLLAGLITPSAGTVSRHPASLTVDLLTQEPEPAGGETVRHHLRRRAGMEAAESEMEAAAVALGTGEPGADDRYAAALERYLRLDAAEGDARVDEALTRVGLATEIAEQAMTTLSGGQATKVGLAALALARSDVLLLDEPTNNVDVQGLVLLEDLLASTDAGVVLVSHDRAFLEDVVTSVLEIDEFSRRGTLYDGGWVAFQEERATARRHAEEAYGEYRGQRQRLLDRSQRERLWATQGVRKAKKDPKEKDKFIRAFKVASSEQVAARARRTEMALQRLTEVEQPREGWELRLTFAVADRAGDLVASLAGAVVERGSFTLGPVDVDITWGERVAIAGPNGSGKTTLLGALLGDLPPVRGGHRLGPAVLAGRLDQARDRFAAHPSVLRAFMEETGADLSMARSALAKLGLDAGKLDRASALLSPGERTRAVLAAFATRGVNLLVLDEPTNHLDLPAIEQVEIALERFPGTVLVITHDRAFLDGLRVGRIIELKDGLVVADTPC